MIEENGLRNHYPVSPSICSNRRVLRRSHSGFIDADRNPATGFGFDVVHYQMPYSDIQTRSIEDGFMISG
ncbi:hypothetical protein D6851_14505 [Altericroceibacterium spongiae]|uniref:Uncharacterized protein n=1 Tax=Altericroceibacterium spongiae TaxID=2320269 RepID=A0A420ECF1_9SPHN|nr:hypothetical protein D6851_14505 [Altericroceibacterium spongiae]